MKIERNRIIVATLLAVAAVGFFLRIQCLGCLGFRWDEDLTSLATKAVMQSGIPELPSGMIYLRFLPYQYVLAGSASLFGFSEFSLRLPGVLFGTVLILLAYWFAARLFDKRIGIAVAACIALSFWQFEMARTARMYAPFFVTWLLAVIAIWRVHVERPERVFSIWPLLLTTVAISLHQLAYSLALVFLIPIFIYPRNWRRIASLVLQAGVTGVLFLAFQRIHAHFFYRAERLADNAEPLAAALPAASPPGLGERVLDAVAGLLGQFAAPNIAGLAALSASAGIVALLALTGWSVLRVRAGAREEPPAQQVIMGIALLCAAAHQFNLVLALLGILVLMKRDGLAGLIQRPMRRLLAYLSLLLAFWLAVLIAAGSGLVALPGLDALGPRKLLRLLADYPNFRLFWSFVMERPALAVFLATGSAWCIDRAARPRPDPAPTFVLLAFWVVLFCNGILASKFEFFRYNLHLDPLYFCLVVIGFWKFFDVITLLAPGVAARAMSSPGRYLLTACGIVLLMIALNPARLWLATHRDYLEAGRLYRVFELARYPDFKTTSAFVRERMAPDDVIIALESREYFNYLGRLDYWLWDSGEYAQTYDTRGETRDLYVDVPTVDEVAELERIVTASDSGDVWILYSREFLANTRWVPDDVKLWLTNLPAEPAYVGRDGVSVVYRLDRP